MHAWALVHSSHLTTAKPPVEIDCGTDAPQLFAAFLSAVTVMTISAPTRNVSKKSKWHRDAAFCKVTLLLGVLTRTLCTYAAAPGGIVSCTERASNPSTVTVVLVFRYRLCTVYLGIIGETMRSSLVPGTILESCPGDIEKKG